MQAPSPSFLSPFDVPVFPPQGFRDFYDPRARHSKEGFDEFLSHLIASRRPALYPDLGQLSGEDQLLITGLHAAFDARPGELDYPHAQPLPSLTTERQQEIVNKVHTDTQHTARLFVSLTDQIYDHQTKTGIESELRPSRLALAGQVIAAWAHDGEKRATGRDYVWHTDDVTKNIEIAWGEPTNTRDRKRKDYNLFQGSTHDGFEGIVHARQLIRKIISREAVTPFLLETVMIMLDEDKSEARHTAQTNLLLTRTIDDRSHKLKIKMPYKRYISNGLIAEPNRFPIPKLGDLIGNSRIEPHPNLNDEERAAKTKLHYGPAIRAIMHTARLERDNDPKQLSVVEAMLKVTAPQIARRREAARKMGLQINHRQVAASFRRRNKA